MLINLKDFKTWKEAEDKLNQIFNKDMVRLFFTEYQQCEIMQDHKKEWDKLHKVERNEEKGGITKTTNEINNSLKENCLYFRGFKPKGYFDNIDIKEIPCDSKNEIQKHDKVIMTNGLFKNLIGEVIDILKTKNIINYVVLMSDENTLSIPETNLKLYEKAECNLPKVKEEIINNMNVLGNIKDVKVVIEPHKTKVQLANGVFGDTSYGYEDEDYDREENIRVAYIHAIRHWCKVLLREE